MKIHHRLFRITNWNSFLSVLIFLLIFSSQVSADGNEFNKNRFSTKWQRASDAELDSLRGGFSLGNGVIIDISFEKIIFKNGVKSFSSFFEFPKNIPLVQNGALNFATDFSNTINSIIQNNLDNQVIRTVNTINIDVSNLKNLGIKGIDSSRSFILPTFQ